METNDKQLKCSLAAMKTANFLQLPADVMQFCIYAANDGKLWCIQADASSLGDVTWKNGNGTNLIRIHQPLLQVGSCLSTVTIIFFPVTHMLPVSLSMAHSDAW